MPKFSNSMTDSAIAASVYERIEAYRVRKGLKQLELAEGIGISIKTYRNIRTGKASISTLLLVMRSLGLVENIDLLIPESTITPIELLKIEAKKRRLPRVRADSRTGQFIEKADRNSDDIIKTAQMTAVSTALNRRKKLKTSTKKGG